MRILFATLILGLGLAASTHADGIYRWVDENGVVHFGSQPPKAKQVEVIKEPKSARYKQWQQAQDALVEQKQVSTDSQVEKAPAPAAKSEEQQQSEQNRAELAAQAQRCASAQQRLQELHSHPRIREVDANGNYRMLPEEERQQRIQQAKQVIQDNC
ncbi:DUF4124 domain-containing protein [Microbulbifer aggregans]|uniref:DUF4124 domain-containing protein n=1 Tax=Microbulbifer aggregans TaxID=1769779 RepID=UPI001CFCF40E|nr:DUF4124 domain-containing protein [Microbulbifer aggregans]